MNKPEQLQPADLGELLFAAMAAQGRADALKAAAVKAAKELAAKTESDARYAESHAKMLASFKRQADRRRALMTWEAECTDAMNQAEVDKEALTLFDRAESMAINAGRL